MLDRELQDFLDAVRRRLWRGLLVKALRRALWGTAALLVLVTALTLAVGRIPLVAPVIAASGLWMLSLAWAVRQRPASRDCALWADRHLGGACAFTTLLELDQGGPTRPDAAALQRLKVWTTMKLPECLKALAEQPDPVRLVRPLLAALVCGSLAALVLNLSGPMPAPVQQAAASSTARAVDRAASGIGASEGGGLASEIAKAVRAADSRRATERGADGRTQETAQGKPVDGLASPQARTGAVPAESPSANATAKSPATWEAFAQAGAARAPGTEADSGSAAGNSLDSRAVPDRSSTPQGTIATRGYELKARRRPDEMQADMERQGTYDEELPTTGQTTVPAATAVAAATPPTATESSRLTPTETSYVQAWMRASARHR